MRARALFRIGALLCVLLLIVVAVAVLRGNHKHSATLRNPDLEYLKAVNSVAPPKDPELMFILMNELRIRICKRMEQNFSVRVSKSLSRS